jgi:DNA-binding GntR family transcriptional regulator
MATHIGSFKRRIGDEHAPLHGQVIVELREAILTGRLKAGERLVEERLAEELGVSRNPVREAIRALASEGLIDVAARRGASVAVMSDQEARETVEVRALLEGQNARLAARRHDKQVIKRIEAVLNKGTAAVAAGRFDQLFQLNQQFHEALAAAGQNRVLGELLQKLRDRTAMLFAPMSPSRQSRTWNEHAGILRAIIDGDERLAATLAAEHVMRAGADFMAGLDVIGGEPSIASGEPVAASAETSRAAKANGHARNRSPASRGTRPSKRSKLA